MDEVETAQASLGLFGKVKNALTKPRGATGGKAAAKGAFFRFPLDEQISFAKRLSVLLKAGIPLLQALQMMQSQTTHSGAKIIVADFVEGVQQGQFLYTRMEKFRKFFGGL